MPAACWLRAWWWPWPPTAIPGPATRPACPWWWPWPCGRWASPPTRRSGAPPPAGLPPWTGRTSGPLALDRADLVILDAPSHIHLAYRPGVALVRSVVVGGRLVVDRAP